MGLSVDLCYKRDDNKGSRNLYCGLKGEVPQHFECWVFYGTKYGTVRGCGPGRQMNNYDRMCPGKVDLYDADGDFIGTANACPREIYEDCGADRCGMPVPKDWYCRTETYRHSGLYEDKVRKVVRCAGPLADEFFNNAIWDACRSKPKGYPIAMAYDENGRLIERLRCGYYGGGDGTLAAWAGMEAGEAEGSSGDQGGPPTDDGEEGGASLTEGGTWPLGWSSPVLGGAIFPSNGRGSTLKQMGISPALDKAQEGSVGEISMKDRDGGGLLRSAPVPRGAFEGDRTVSSVKNTSQDAKADTVWRSESVFQAVAAQVKNLLSKRTTQSVTSTSADPKDRTANDRNRRQTVYPAGEPVREGSSTSPEVSRDAGEPTRTSVVPSRMSGTPLAIGGLAFCGGTAFAIAAYYRRRNAAWRSYE